MEMHWSHLICCCADTGDGQWDGVIPEPARKEMREAKGKVHEMGAKPWWCAPPAPAQCALYTRP
jgi:hypothetical protein